MNRAPLFWTFACLCGLATVVGTKHLVEQYPAKAALGDDKPAQFRELLLDIATSYKSAGRVDFEARWAPGLCRVPEPGLDYTPAKARMSASEDAQTHGRKLYFLFAKDRHAYRELTAKPARDDEGEEFTGPECLPMRLQALQQFVVKESWMPVEIDKERRAPLQPGENADPYAIRDGKTYIAGTQGDLYIMFKLDPKTPETDNGWVYGTVTADTKKVTSAGRVESCMSCHKDAKHDRLFGLNPR